VGARFSGTAKYGAGAWKLRSRQLERNRMINIDIDQPIGWLAQKDANVLSSPGEVPSQFDLRDPQVLPAVNHGRFGLEWDRYDAPAAANKARGDWQGRSKMDAILDHRIFSSSTYRRRRCQVKGLDSLDSKVVGAELTADKT
jgi:hypothetical protein